MAKYELLSGKHVHADGKRYVAGETIVTGVELDKLFKNKFRRVGGAIEASPALAPPTPRSTTAKPEPKPEPAGRGIEVSEDYPDALACGLRVFRRGGWYHVFDGEDTTPKNEHALRKEDVAGVVARLLEE